VQCCTGNMLRHILPQGDAVVPKQPGWVDEATGELGSFSLAQIRKNEKMKECWQKLSCRQQQMTALTCLGFTNRQIAAHLGISKETVKTHVHNTQLKFQLHGIAELQEALMEWDFSSWAK